MKFRRYKKVEKVTPEIIEELKKQNYIYMKLDLDNEEYFIAKYLKNAILGYLMYEAPEEKE